ncbi:MAG: hypothetical protein ACKE51_02470 [Methylococcaceae bacterium]
MKFLKNAFLAVLLTFSLGASVVLAETTTAVANITAHIDEAIKSIDANDVDGALAHTKQAKRAKGELNSEGNAAKIGRLAKHFNNARKLLRKSDLAGAKAELQAAKSGYNSIQF